MASSLSLQTILPFSTSRFSHSSPLSSPSLSPSPPSPHLRRLLRRHLSCSAAAEAPAQVELKKEKPKVVVKTMEKPRVVLKFIWMEKNIGLGLDQMIPGHGCVPLSPYYFWPRKDAWEELKTKLEEKPWISQKRMIILLNQATDIINLWQQAGGSL